MTMQSPKRENKIPIKPSFKRSHSLHEAKQINLVSSSGNKAGASASGRTTPSKNSTDDVVKKERHGGINYPKNKSCRNVATGFVGFGAPHPKLNTPMKQKSQSMLIQEGSLTDNELLKGAERLIQNILQNEKATINQESIQKAIQHHTTLKAKKRYSSLLQKPWRTSTNPLYEDTEYSETSSIKETIVDIEGKNQKTFRRSASYDDSDAIINKTMKSQLMGSPGKKKLLPSHSPHKERRSLNSLDLNVQNRQTTDAIGSIINEDDQIKKSLNEANLEIQMLRQQLAENEEMERIRSLGPPVKDDDINDESLSSTNIEDDSFAADTHREAPPHSYVRSLSPDPRTKKAASSDNVVSRLEYRALQIRNEQLLQTIKMYEEQLSTNNTESDSSTTSNVGKSSALHEKEKEIMVNIVSRLNVADNEQTRQLKYMESKIASLVQQLNNSEARQKSLVENEALSKSTIENLSMKLVECELKAKEFNENLMIQTEKRIDFANKALRKMEIEVQTAKEEAAQANITKISSESMYSQLEQSHEQLVLTLRNQLIESENKSRRLEDEVNNLMATSVEMIQLKTDMQSLQRKLQQSESTIIDMRSNEPLIKQAAIDDVQRRADIRIETLEKTLAATKVESETALRRLADLELAQAKEQEILSEELRDSETTIACLMEEVESLKPLMAQVNSLEQQLKDSQETFELKEMEIAESKSALKQAECEVEELRNELHMLITLPDIVRKMEKELQDTKAKLINDKSNHGDSKKLRVSLALAEANADSLRNEVNELKPIALQLPVIEEELKDLRTLLHEKDIELSKASKVQLQLDELQEAYYMAEDEVVELKSQVEIMKPLATDLEIAERELQVTCAKLDAVEREMDILMNEIDLLRPLSSDLNDAERELAEAKSQLAERNQEILMYQSKVKELEALIQSNNMVKTNESDKADNETITKLVAELEFSKKQIIELTSQLEYTERKVTDMDLERHNDGVKLREMLKSSEEQVVILKQKLDDHSESDSLKNLLAELKAEIDEKDKAITSLKLDIAEMMKTTADSQLLNSSMEEDLKVKEQKIMELTPLVESLRAEINNNDMRSTKITLDYATLISEKDSLRKSLAVLTSRINELENELKNKNAMIQDLTHRNNDSDILETLQKEQERTLERCSDLSLQLAESQFTISELTEQLRANKKEIQQAQQLLPERKSLDSFRPPKAFQTLLNSGIDRISSRLDDSLRSTSTDRSTNNTAANGNRFRSQNMPTNRNYFGT